MTKEQTDSKEQVVDIDSLRQDTHNFNRGTEEGQQLMERSFKELGAGRSILLDREGNIIAGNKSQEAARKAGIKRVRIVETTGDELVAVKRTDIDIDSAEGRRMALLDNLTTQVNLAWDPSEIEAVSSEIDGFDPSDYGFDPSQLEVAGMGDETTPATHTEVKEDDFDPEEVHETKVKRGEIWTLGAHRLMCGDSTNTDDLKRLLGEVTPDLIYTDPPYGMNAVSNSGVLKEKYKTDIHGDEDNTIAINAFKLCQLLFTKSRQVWWGANYYTECLPSSECWLVWDKNNGMSDQTDCELAWSNYRSVVRQFTMVSEKQNRIHPTQKPCKLFADIVTRMKKKDTYNNVLDLFGGSGSTMIACEQMGIKSFTMEYDPHFCTEIIARWEKFTGQKATKQQP